MGRALTCYLAGAITGESFGSATNWREYVKNKLNPGIAGLSPLRAKDYLAKEEAIGDSYETQNGIETPLSTSRGIMTRDFFDCQNCDVMIAYLKGTKKVSIGTVMEIAWAYAFNKPLILVMEAATSESTGFVASEGNIHEHSMIREATGYRVDTIDKAILIVNAILTDYVGK